MEINQPQPYRIEFVNSNGKTIETLYLQDEKLQNALFGAGAAVSIFNGSDPKFKDVDICIIGERQISHISVTSQYCFVVYQTEFDSIDSTIDRSDPLKTAGRLVSSKTWEGTDKTLHSLILDTADKNKLTEAPPRTSSPLAWLKAKLM